MTLLLQQGWRADLPMYAPVLQVFGRQAQAGEHLVSRLWVPLGA